MKGFRVKRTSNAATVHHLHELIFNKSAPWESADAYWLLHDDSREDSTEIGFASAQYMPGDADTDYDDPAVFLHRAGVFKQYSGYGLQRRLILVRERWARQQGARWAVTYTSRSNSPSMANLLKMGYMMKAPWIGYSPLEWQFFEKEL